MKIFDCLLIVLISLTIASCTKDSTEIELNDPSFVGANIILTKTMDSNGINSSDMRVGLSDINGNFVPVKDGWVKVNGNLMKVKQNIVNNKKSYYYSADDIYNDIGINTLYDFEIKLSDGKVYNASITTQDKELYELSLPDSQPKNTDMQISWKEIDLINPIRLTVIRIYENDGTIWSQGMLGFKDAENGAVTITKDHFVDSSTRIKQAMVRISSLKSGKVDSRLSTGSDITSTFNIERTCVVK